MSVVSASEAPLNFNEIYKILQSRDSAKYKYSDNSNRLTKLVESGLLDKYYDGQAGEIVYAPTAKKVFVNGRLEIGLEANGRSAEQDREFSEIDVGEVIQSLSSDSRRYIVKILSKRTMRLDEILAAMKENGHGPKNQGTLFREAEKLVKSDVLEKYYNKDSSSILYKSNADQIIINLNDFDVTVGVTDADLSGYGPMREEFERNDTGLILRALNSPLSRVLIKILSKEKMSTKEALEAVNMAGFDAGFRENIYNVYNVLNLLRKAGLVEKYHVPDKKEFVYTTNLDGILIDMNSMGTLLLRK